MDAKGELEITYSLYQIYLNEIKDLEDSARAAEEEQVRIKDNLREARKFYVSLDKSLFSRISSTESVSKQLFQDTDEMDFMENSYQEELRVLKAENEDVNSLKHRMATMISNAKLEAEALKVMSHDMEAKLLEIQKEMENIKSNITTYEKSSLQEKDKLKQQVQVLADKNKELSKAVDSITSEIAAKSKSQKNLKLTLTKTKDELRSLISLFAKKQEKEEAQANDRKATLYEEVIASGAPTGEVTLIFSSVDGSKELWEMFPMAMTLAIDIHNNTVKNRIKSTGGYEVKSDGDSFMVAFSDVFSGLQYCMLVQEDLLGALWPQEILSSPYAAEKQSADGRLLFSGLRCRMGIHVGQPQCRPNPVTGRMDYLGSMVNKSARVAGLAHGGQVFVSDTALKSLFDIKDENCQVYMSQLGIRCVGTFPLRGIQGEEKITEILPRTLKDRQFSPVEINLPQSPTAAVAKEIMTKQPTAAASLQSSGEALVQEYETPGAQFAKFAEIHEPLPHLPNAPPNLLLEPPPQTQPNTSHLSVTIPSPSTSPTPSPSYGTPIIESMESLTKSLLSSMSMKSIPGMMSEESTEQTAQDEGYDTTTKKFPFTPSLIISHPDDVILKRHEEKLKDVEEKLIRLKSDLAKVKTEKDEVRDKLKGVKDAERLLKFKHAAESNETQERQQDLAKMAFEKLHTIQLLEQARSNITGIRTLLKTLEERVIQTTASRDHARNAYQYWDRMMKMCTPEVLIYAKKSTQLEADWGALRSGKVAYFNAAKNLEKNIDKVEESTKSIAAPIEEELLIEQVLELREAESDLVMIEVIHKDKQAEVESLKGYIQQLQATLADETPLRSLLTTKELSEKTAQQEQQLQRLNTEKQRYLQEIKETHKTMLQELDQQQKTIKQVHVEISAEVQRTHELKTKFGGAIADKYQEVVQHVQLLEQSQKLSKSRDRRGPLSPLSPGDKNIDRKSLFASADSRGINKLSGHHSTVNLLDSGSKKESRAGSRSPTEKDNPVSVRSTKGYSSSYTLLEKRRERADRLSRGSRREDMGKIDEVDPVGTKNPEKGEYKELGSSPSTESSVGAFEPNSSQLQGGSQVGSATQPRPQAGSGGESNALTQARNQAESQIGGQNGVQGSNVAPQESQVGAQGYQASVYGSQASVHGSQASVQGSQASVQGSQASVQGSQASVQGSQAGVPRFNLGPQGQSGLQPGAIAGPTGSQPGAMSGPTGSQPSGPSHSLPSSSIGPSSLQGPPGLHLKSYGLHSETLQGSSLSNTSGDNKQQSGSIQQGSGRLGSGRGGPIGKLQARGLSGGQMSPIQTPNTNNDNNRDGGEGNSYDFRSIALVQNELAARLAANHQIPSDLDATRDQMAALSRLAKGTKLEEADLSVVGVGTTSGDGYALPLEDKQQRMSFSLLRLAMQIRPEVYNRRRGARLEDLKVAGQKLLS